MNPENYQHYQALIFDMDGTLVDSGQLHELAWRDALGHFGLPLDRARMRALAGVPTLQTVEILLAEAGAEGRAAEPIALRKQRLVNERLLDFVKPTPLANIARHYAGKKPMAVGTGALSGEAEKILRACDLLDLMAAVVGADQVARPKPAPDTFARCAQLLGVPAAQCVVFEDSPIGLQAAHAAGMSAVNVIDQLGLVNDYFLAQGETDPA